MNSPVRARPVPVNPALAAFLEALGAERTVAQVVIRRRPGGFELRHISDQDRPAPELRRVTLEEVRPLARFTPSGQFRPLKSAPNLQTGWRLEVRAAAELETALDRFYPGFLPDWYAVGGPQPPVTSFEEFTARQTGMYRITARLEAASAGAAVRACCHARFCLKRRFWKAEAAPPDDPSGKSIIPCLEPCALLLEFARRAKRIEQEDSLSLELHPGDAQVLLGALETAIEHPDPAVREGDFNEPGNPRRVQLVLEKVAKLAAARVSNTAPAPPGAGDPTESVS